MSIIKRKAGSEDIVKSILDFDEVPTEGSPNLVESGAVAKFTDAVPEGTTPENPLVNESALVELELAMLTNITPADNTLRFYFSKKDYDPTVAGIGSGGTWKKLITLETNVWDWNRSSNNWDNSFKDAFSNQDNIVKVIATGNLSSIASANYLFQNCKSFVYCADTNLTNATAIAYMFDSCSKLEKIPNLGTTQIGYCQRACAECVNVSSGSLALYNALSSQETLPANKTNCFFNCGKNTTTGSAELAQIPVSWGGTMPNP